jgi:hypothetical protein
MLGNRRVVPVVALRKWLGEKLRKELEARGLPT